MPKGNPGQAKPTRRRSVDYKTEMANISWLCQPLSESQALALRRLEAQERAVPMPAVQIRTEARRINKPVNKHPFFDQ